MTLLTTLRWAVPAPNVLLRWDTTSTAVRRGHNIYCCASVERVLNSTKAIIHVAAILSVCSLGLLLIFRTMRDTKLATENVEILLSCATTIR